jgi:Hypoxia induced protein conserved region
MTVFFNISALLAMVCVVGVLIIGLFSMVKGGAFNEKYGNKLMQARIALQGLALMLLALAYFTSKG